MTRSDAYITVECDWCGETDEISLIATARGDYSDREVENRLYKRGWKKDGDQDFCSQVCYEAYLADIGEGE